MASSCKIVRLQMCLVAALTLVESRVIREGRQPRLSLAASMGNYYYRNIDGHPGTYAFGYDVADPATGNQQYRTEQRYPNGTVAGSYGYIDANGISHRHDYIADAKGYRVKRWRPEAPLRSSIAPPPKSSSSSDYYTHGAEDEQPEVLIITRRGRRLHPSVLPPSQLTSPPLTSQHF